MGLLAGRGPFIQTEAAAPSFTAEAVTFESNTDVLYTPDSDSLSSTKKCIVSFWLYLTSIPTVPRFFRTSADSGGGTITDVLMQGTPGPLRFRVEPGSSIYLLTNKSSGWTGAWHHILVAIDSANGTFQFYIDDVDDLDSGSSTTVTNGSISWGQQKWDIGGDYDNGPISNGMEGSMAEFYLNRTEFLDMSVTSNRRKFIDASGKPVDLGSDGSTPTGNQPAVYFSGDSTVWNNGSNKGSLTGWTMVGSVTDSSNEPVEL